MVASSNAPWTDLDLGDLLNGFLQVRAVWCSLRRLHTSPATSERSTRRQCGRCVCTQAGLLVLFVWEIACDLQLLLLFTSAQFRSWAQASAAQGEHLGAVNCDLLASSRWLHQE